MMIVQSNKISICTTFSDAFKLFGKKLFDYNYDIIVSGYDYNTISYHDIGLLEYICQNNFTFYNLHSMHLGLLNYHGFLPEAFREDILSDKSTKALFGIMHTIFFFQYIKALEQKYEYIYWRDLLSKTYCTSDVAFNIGNKRIKSGLKSTNNLKQDYLANIIADIINIDVNNISIQHNHIFKILKTYIYLLSNFSLGQHTIGNHYYTSRCLFVKINLSSTEYNQLVYKLDTLKEELSLQAPEFKIIILAVINDCANLNFNLGSAKLGLDTWTISNYQDLELSYVNYIF